ncbi:HAMP domain-containing protein [Heliorestis acidaminivorans]|uniref:histidine kinase n=1 Tax=Heliorestis acidaminivorans TaxID=553427 RepID=A0A6I0ES11_9FIRM|nr:HAMP domain-containing sensor histidine kinase [Heliorestis acidaminivorans]KAB2953280.1 HAMP domain-containing protein [Heliorestis acidaminivorans]
MKYWQSIVFKIWLVLILFSLALLALTGWLFNDMIGTFTVQRETRDLAGKAALVGLEKDMDRATQLAHAISFETGALVMFGDSNGRIEETFAQPITSMQEMGMGRQGRLHRWGQQEPLMGPGIGRELKRQENTLSFPTLTDDNAQINVTVEEKIQLEQGQVISRQGPLPFLDVPVLAVFVPILEDDEVSRVVYILSPLHRITQDLQQLQMGLLSAVFFLLLLSGFSAFLISRKVARPLTRLHKTAEEMRRGNYQQPLAVEGNDEIGRLGQTLHTLSQELAKTVETLEQKNQQLARGVQSMRDLAANVSHDLRTPLFLIQGYAEALRDDMPRSAQERREMAEIILSETARMEGLVKDLMELARLESGYFHFEMAFFSPVQLVEELCHKMAGPAKDQGIQLHYGVPTKTTERSIVLQEIWADRSRIEQALINLLENALRHTPKGGEVRINLEPSQKGLIFSVADTGPGLTEEDVPRVWERFYRGDKSRSRQTEASGLGLAIVKAIVEGHHGQVGLENNPGKGARFFFFIPYKSEE